METKKLILAAGTGFLGEVLIKNLHNLFDEIVILTRGENKIKGNVKFVHWDAAHPGDWQHELENASVVMNLAGKNVNCRYNKKNKAEIFSSRENSTAIIGKTIEHLKNPPELWINCASATIYRHSEDKPMTEKNAEYGEGFSVEVCKRWEKIFYSFSFSKTRQVGLRIGMVLGNEGGVFPVLVKLSKLGLGGTMGNGKQMVSWIDEYDFCAMVKWLIENKFAEGSYNCTSPFPLTNRESSKLLRTKLNKTIGIPATKWMLGFGAFFMRTEPELVLKSRYVIPEKATQQGFQFKYPTFENCLNHLLTN
jgi:uncharacterized protein